MRDYKIGSRVSIDVLWVGETYTGEITGYDENTITLESNDSVYFIEHAVVGKVSYLN